MQQDVELQQQVNMYSVILSLSCELLEGHLFFHSTNFTLLIM